MLKTFLSLCKDVILLLISLALALWFRSFIREGQLGIDTYTVFRHFILFVPIICISVLFFLIYGLYDRHVLYKRRKLIQHILMASVGTFIGGIVWFYLFPLDLGLRPKLILLFYVVFSAICATLARYRYLFYGKDGNKLEASSFNMSGIGGGNEIKRFFAQLKEVKYTGYKPIDLIDPQQITTDQGVQILREKLLADKVQYVVLDTRDDHAVQLGRKLYYLVFEGVKFVTFQDMYERVYDREDLTYIDEEWFIGNITAKNDYVYMILKRVLDLLVVLPLFLISLIFYPFIWLAIKIEDGGPLFAKMERIGQNNKVINIIKFRSMRGVDDGTWVLKEGNAEQKKNEGRQMRVTKVGKFIRKTRIDEFPQFWNIIRGDLSMVGPRPEMPKMVEVYEKEIPFYSARHTVRPGLSGWAQIHHEIPPHSIEGTKEKLSYDLYYLKHRSFFLDLLIILRTVQTFLSAVGV
ncbi:MAG: hypothetical protein RJB39_584 [Candidatus Parcubacteria bacterium]|jgi:exopolysaccharide biosynthesis polyprenyl glycosylphosphotransferase